MQRTRDDLPRLGEHRWHPATGALTCWAVGAVVGVYPYPERGYNAFVSEETLSDPASLDTLPGAVLTLRHAEKDISPDTYQEVTQGAVFAGHFDEREQGIVFPVAINGADALAAIRAGARHLSMGYLQEPPVEQPGEYDGQAYDVVQRGRRYFEVALLPADQTPRGGPRCRLLIDRTVDALPTTQPAETPGGATVTPEEMQAKIAQLTSELEAERAKTAAMSAEMMDMKTKMDAAEIGAAAPEIEMVAADMGVPKGNDAASTLSAITDALKMPAKGKDALPTIRALAERFKSRDAKPPAPPRPTFTTPPAPMKTGDANSTTDAAPAVQESM